jgi:hypothetical protein
VPESGEWLGDDWRRPLAPILLVVSEVAVARELTGFCWALANAD